ncbi:MAG: hypothetical protein R6V55_09655, partial [Desulfovermiculus sp.]
MIVRFFLSALAAVFLGMAPGWPAGIQAAGEADEPEQKPGQVRAFMYHHFGLEDKYPSTSVSVDQFKKHLTYLKEHDYTVLTFGEALGRLY